MALRWQLFAQQVHVAEHGGEDVVEVVGDAAREPPDRFHLLRLTQLEFELAALGNVTHRAEHAAIGQQPSVDLDGEDGAVFAE